MHACSQGEVLRQNHWDNVAEYSSHWTFCNMLQILGTPGYTCNRLRLLLQNSFEDDELPVQVKNCMCSHGFRHELRTFQPNAFQDMFLDTWKLMGKNVLLNCMHQPIPSANVLPPRATPRVLHLLSARVPGFVPSELTGGCLGVGTIIYYHKYQVVS